MPYGRQWDSGLRTYFFLLGKYVCPGCHGYTKPQKRRGEYSHKWLSKTWADGNFVSLVRCYVCRFLSVRAFLKAFSSRFIYLVLQGGEEKREAVPLVCRTAALVSESGSVLAWKNRVTWEARAERRCLLDRVCEYAHHLEFRDCFPSLWTPR